MRALSVIMLIALSGCAFWRTDAKRNVQKEEAPAKSVVFLEHAAASKTEDMFARSIELALQSSNLEEKKADGDNGRLVKANSVGLVTRYAAWAMGLGFIAFLFGGMLPIPGIRSSGAWTVGLGAAIATAAPWLSDFLDDDKVKLAGYASFSILALAVSIGVSWLILDKVRDEANK